MASSGWRFLSSRNGPSATFDNLGQCAPIMELLLKWAKEDLEGAGPNPATDHGP
jgi:hypothetical protein